MSGYERPFLFFCALKSYCGPIPCNECEKDLLLLCMYVFPYSTDKLVGLENQDPTLSGGYYKNTCCPPGFHFQMSQLRRCPVPARLPRLWLAVSQRVLQEMHAPYHMPSAAFKMLFPLTGTSICLYESTLR